MLDGVPREGESLRPNAKTPDYKIDPETGCWQWQKSTNRKPEEG